MGLISGNEQPSNTPANSANLLNSAAYGTRPPMPSAPQEDFFKYRLDPTQILEDIEHELRGEVFDANKGAYVQKFEKELTDEGIAEILALINSCGINKNIILGCLTHEEIYSRCNRTWRKLAKFFVTDGHRIGLDKNKRDLLIQKIVSQIHSGLSRSEEGRESDQLSTAHQRVEHFLSEEKQRRGGLFNFARKGIANQ